MTRRGSIKTVHEPFGDAWYFGPERLADRYANDSEKRAGSGFSDSTYHTIMEEINRNNAEVRHRPLPLDASNENCFPMFVLSPNERGDSTHLKSHDNMSKRKTHAFRVFLSIDYLITSRFDLSLSQLANVLCTASLSVASAALLMAEYCVPLVFLLCVCIHLSVYSLSSRSQLKSNYVYGVLLHRLILIIDAGKTPIHKRHGAVSLSSQQQTCLIGAIPSERCKRKWGSRAYRPSEDTN